MSDNRKYFYYRLRDNFFSKDAIRVLLLTENGYRNIIILIYIYLIGSRNNGEIKLSDNVYLTSEMISALFNVSVNDINECLNILESLSLLRIEFNGKIVVDNIIDEIGKSSSEADRMRKKRKVRDNKK